MQHSTLEPLSPSRLFGPTVITNDILLSNIYTSDTYNIYIFIITSDTSEITYKEGVLYDVQLQDLPHVQQQLRRVLDESMQRQGCSRSPLLDSARTSASCPDV